MKKVKGHLILWNNSYGGKSPTIKAKIKAL